MRNGSRRWAVALAATAAVALAVPASAQAQTEKGHADTQVVLDRYRAKSGPGAAVYAGGRTGVWHLHSGTARAGWPHRPVRTTDHFRIASQTKTFTAAVVLQLVDEKRVELDAPIERYLPGVVRGNGYDGNKITVRQILQHTSGIANPPVSAIGRVPSPDGTIALGDLVRRELSHPPQFAPGTSWGYSNTNYHLAGLLIERITRTTVVDAVTSRIIRPLGLTETTLPRPGDRTLGEPYLPGYTGRRVGPFLFWTETTFTYPGSNVDIASVGSSAGGIVSTLKDLTTFFRALLGGEVVSASALAEMRRTVPVPGHSQGYGYGLGLMRQPLSCGGAAWGHPGGSATGYSSMTAVTDDARHAAVVTNTESSASSPAQEDVIDSALCGSR
ncbi:serine hydrolase domain-containing protein [Streptoalloteichus hindustanus]|uniref:D-alanyl-D-alanine carboxypeptidase n=1 Tax=Streptoalloteichus hindustanus TaxID=2017 RepID=A0A1M5CRV8_STRHI|nr:serine hydrolase domain-containing protein [Streptoalloteichus hindustanus]SHF57455.1 D-alanyl-D-alanine carboxypeptidase [Streptoalloteichus hindustanus]